MPLALLPASAWPIGQVLAGQLPAEPIAMLGAFIATLLFSVSTVVLLALAFLAVTAFYELPRSWNRALSVAAYASTPVFLAGTLLIVPVLIIASIAALFHSLVLAYLGVQRLLGCREHDAAAFVAISCVVTGALSMLLGALCSAVGLI